MSVRFEVRRYIVERQQNRIMPTFQAEETNSYSRRTYTRYVPIQSASRNSIAQTAPRLWQPPQMSFRGVKRRGNPLNRNENTVAIAIDRICFRNFYRATTLHSQNEMDKNSSRNSVRVLAWCVRLWRKRILENFVRYICDNLHHFPSGRLPRLRSQ